MDKIRKKIFIRGLVQGVGFRPFIYRLAHQHGISGWVVNRSDGVTISAEGNRLELDNFLRDIPLQAPRASSIFEMVEEADQVNGEPGFHIRKSNDVPGRITEISPDIAVCDACLKDMNEQHHRLDYPFINCTHCGPRFTIIRDLPYDRAMTTMAPFILCDKCRNEYQDVSDRRFHAQPVACNACGPHYTLSVGNEQVTGTKKIIEKTAQMIGEGKTVAIKGLGGYHLACDAFLDEAVKRLRKKKLRDGKPFAVMFRDIETAGKYTHISAAEEKALTSWRRPIVILRNRRATKKMAQDISMGFDTTGVMLPYMPLHYLLFEELNTPAIVLTSGNISDEPVIIDDREAEVKLREVSDALLSYNREIYNRADDSVEMYIDDTVQPIRRSRGYIPSPIRLSANTEGIVAVGAELVNCFCIGKGNEAILSQHIGDLKNLETLEFFAEALQRFTRMFRVSPELIVHDLHPDYLSTRYAIDRSADGIPLVAVQHHHAHIASCLAEHQVEGPVIGISFDGVGLGDDGNIWGGEFFIADLLNYERQYHFDYLPAPGGDLATEQPWRMAVSYLYQAFGSGYRELGLEFTRSIDPHHLDMVEASIIKNINAPLTSSAGRLFDAVSALINLCPVSSFHAEAPMRLENIAKKGINASYSFGIADGVISFRPAFREITFDLLRQEDPRVISAKFHNTMVEVITEVADLIRASSGIVKVALSGGSFQNRIIIRNASKALRKRGFEVYTQQKVPANDGGIALGQLAIAARRREEGNLELKI